MGLLDSLQGSGDFSSDFRQGFRGAMYSPQEQEQLAQSDMRKGYQDAAASGGLDGALDYLERTDPEKALSLRAKQQDLSNSYLQAAMLKTQDQRMQQDIAQQNAEFVAKANDVILRQPSERQQEVYQQMLPLLKQHDPAAPDAFDPQRAQLSVALHQKGSEPTELMKNLGFADTLETQGRGDLASALRSKLTSDGKTVVNVNTAEGAGSKLREGLIASDVADLKGYRDLSVTAQSDLQNISTAKQLLAAGAKTGFGQPQLMQMKAVLKAGGVDVNEKQLGNQQALNGYLKQFNLNLMQKMKGAISDREQEMLAQAAPELGKTPEGNARLMDALEVSANRTIQASEFRRAYLEQNGSARGADSAWANYINSRPALSQDPKTGQIAGVNKAAASNDSWEPFLNKGFSGALSTTQAGLVKDMSPEQIQQVLQVAKQKGKSDDDIRKMMHDINAIKQGATQDSVVKPLAANVQPVVNDPNVYRAFTQLTPKANPTILAAMTNNMDIAVKNGINTPQRQAAFVAQLAHETAGFKTMREYASGKDYEGRRSLGNTEPGDGMKYKGRGFIQLTGKNNYASYGKRIGEDLVRHPELAERPDVAMKIAVAYWNDHNLNAKADKGDLVGISKAINGGLNGLASRAKYYRQAQRIMASL